ncbi:DoxX family protein [Halobacteriovorax sp. GB3]|uniref:DoxX family protein n=1 Tax=Halobacteriovorax sp. GB3 TaxID=2719615 RepID=UPI002360E5DE|nr:DoxX family protein [Halobacteriovorax sp. GB3]MDD0854344.1 DoxX family protein [Halobacteriovorax sp. GB3]
MNAKNYSLISLILRIAIGSLFLGTGLIKISGGIDGTIAYYMSMFEKTIFPIFLIKLHASIIIFVELFLAVWLLSGIQLRKAWIFSILTLISLAFGMIFTYKFNVVSDNYIYVVISCLGLLLEPYDTYRKQ